MKEIERSVRFLERRDGGESEVKILRFPNNLKVVNF